MGFLKFGLYEVFTMTKQNDSQALNLETSMKKTDYISHIASRTELPRKKVEELMAIEAEIIAQHLQKGFPFSWNGLLKFHTVEKAATEEREARNPFTGKMGIVPGKPAHKVVRVKPLTKLKDMVKDIIE